MIHRFELSQSMTEARCFKSTLRSFFLGSHIDFVDLADVQVSQRSLGHLGAFNRVFLASKRRQSILATRSLAS